jgi:hypothetical protein
MKARRRNPLAVVRRAGCPYRSRASANAQCLERLAAYVPGGR